jgi:hypothetical protein
MTLPVNYETTRPQVCAFFAGRAWYAGIKSSEKSGWVLFSQIATDLSKFHRCYQEGDPTSEVFSDLADNDGGIIVIPDAGEIVELKALGPSLLVFATNGVWQIIGGTDGFKASAYSVQKISNTGCVAPKSVIEVEEMLMYWANNGIYVIKLDQNGNANVENSTDVTIKTFYQSIPTLNRFYADASYNTSAKVVWWAFNKNVITSTSEGRYRKTRILCFDVRLGAWYVYDITSGSPIPVALAVTNESQQSTQEYTVISGTDDVLVSTDTVIADIPVINSSVKQFKLLTLHPVTTNNYSITWSDFNNTSFKDWYTYDTTGTDAPAYLITGYQLGNNGPARTKTGGYVTAFLKRTETSFDVNANPVNPSSCFLQTRWDFTDNTYTGKWSDEYQVYRQLRPYWAEPSTTFDDGYPLVITKNKIRGRGKAVQMKWSSEVGKDMKIVGWSTTFVGNTNV